VLGSGWFHARLQGRTISRHGGVVAAVFAAGIMLRVVFVVLYRPAFIGVADAGSYIYAAHLGLFANVYDPAGYPVFLRVLHALYPHLTLVVLVQHALGVVSAWLLYSMVRRVTGSMLIGLLPAAIVLFDGYSLWVEHTPITETLFTFGVCTVLWMAVRAVGGGWLWLVCIGVVGALAAMVRPVGLVLIAIVGLWMLWARAGTWLARLGHALLVLVPAAALMIGYVVAQHGVTGFTGITQDSGRIIYARAALFAKCSEFTPPAGTAALCEQTPPSKRGSFNQYLTGFPDGARGVTEAGRSISPAWRVFGPPPAGNSKLQAFGITAIIHQPFDYVRSVAHYFRAYWSDHHRRFFAADERVDPGVEQTVVGYYHTAGVHNGGLGFLTWYGKWIEITGPLTIILLLLPVLGFATTPPARRVAVLLAATGWLLPLAADASATVDPRFILPAYGPLAAAGAIGLNSQRVRGALRRRRTARREQAVVGHP
jgi:4-amino-4-deoxy-L-arabinose transferase-like glycosyltransferase